METMIFITGGVRSGKSTFAEKVAIEMAKKFQGNLNYIATGVGSDTEMLKRIERHKQERADSKQDWKTWEKPTHIGELASVFNNNDVVLLDCVTTLLNNELFSNQSDWDEEYLNEIYRRVFGGIVKIHENCSKLILVSNEVLYEAIGGNELVIAYSRILGRLHQDIVAKAEYAYLVESGVPILMKGETM